MSMHLSWRTTIASLAVGLAVGLSLVACSQPLKFSKDDSATVLAFQTITAENPAEPGAFKVVRMFYGSGTDKQRKEFKDSVTYKTKAVDVSPYVTVPPTAAGDRKDFWGFDMKAVPLNARVWYPEGAGPFPLVLVVHGNHNAEDFSDPGYGYLGELLASRGFILASVDENFINGLSGENDGRAWLMLKHLEQWKRFNDSSSGPLSHKIDMDRIAVMGHSRGGEAAALAAAFNTLTFYPDDAKQKFKFNFHIRSVVAIAPVDGQYKPASKYTPIENVNYLLLHGSHDGDVSTAVGMRQYERLRFTDGQEHFKAMFFMYRANHGQWNSVWQNKDNGPRSGRSLELAALVPIEDQRQMGKLVISGFLEATLHGKSEYLPMFRDHRTAGHWFPKSMYTTRFMENGFRTVADYEEDIDVTTGAPSVTIETDSLATWKENVIPFRGMGTDDQRNNAVWIGWNNRIAGPDTTKMGRPASYTLTIADSLVKSWNVTAKGVLYLSLAPTKDKPSPRALPKDTTKKSDSTKKADSLAAKLKADSVKSAAKNPKKDEADTIPVDFTVELTDADGHTARMPISRYGAVRRPLEVHLYRRKGRDEQRFTNTFEYVPQSFILPLADFATASTEFRPDRLKSIRLLFNKTFVGTIILDDVGITPSMSAKYMAAPLKP